MFMRQFIIYTKNKIMKTNYLNLFFLISFCFLLFGCHKENFENTILTNIDKTKLEQLKQYYNEQVDIFVKTNKNIAILGEPQWDKTIYSLENRIYIIPVVLNVVKSQEQFSTYKFLLITTNSEKIDGSFYYAVVNNQKSKKVIQSQDILKNIFLSDTESRVGYEKGISFIKTPISFDGKVINNKGKTYHQSLNFLPVAPLESKVKDSVVVSNLCESGGSEVCYNFYLLTWEDNVIIAVDFLYSICSCPYGGGGTTGTGNSNSCQAMANNFAYSGGPVSVTMREYQASLNDIELVCEYDWKIFSAFTWGIISYERIKWKRAATNLAFTFFSYATIGDTPVGASIGGTRTYNIIEKTGTNYYNIRALVKIKYTVTSQVICSITTPINPPVTLAYAASKTFRPCTNYGN